MEKTSFLENLGLHVAEEISASGERR